MNSSFASSSSSLPVLFSALSELTRLVRALVPRGEPPQTGGTLVLPRAYSLRESGGACAEAPEVTQLLDALRQARDDVGVAVVFQERDDAEWTEELVSPAFWAHVRRMRKA
ncbi:hypothetical protein DMC30DRAFT_86971 [Rhodotorula diobovata]|uniref:Uncharacterized protein n=1 Tax=Rhodotorula diobovata TaxID=5288 RepID=A0A5C5G4Z2_9BASI|nr:hypothetical protein DMC30DRAFT_86971 [Rhodotorula diobovata]